DPHDEIRVLARARDGLPGRGPADVLQLPDQAADHPLDGDVEEGQDPRPRPLDNVTPQPGEGLGAGRTRVDRGRHAPAEAMGVRRRRVGETRGKRGCGRAEGPGAPPRPRRVDPRAAAGRAALPGRAPRVTRPPITRRGAAAGPATTTGRAAVTGCDAAGQIDA